MNAALLLKNKMADLNTSDADLAYEEMIADACETMLLDSNAAVKLMELRKSDLDLFEKIKLHIHKILSEIRNFYKSMGYGPSSDEAKALIGMKDVLERFYSLFEDAAVDATQNYQAMQGAESVGTKEIKKQLKKIKADMTDEERYDVLKDTKIIVIEDLKSEHEPVYSEIEKNPEKAKGQVEKLVKELADNLDILNIPLTATTLDIEFQLSKNNGLKESLSQQLKYGGIFHDFSKALINLRDILDRSVLIEVHTEDRYKGTQREDINFAARYVLFSAFKSKEHIIPVKLEIKQKKDAQNILYVVVSMSKIERISVMESALDDIRTSNIPLSDTDSIYSLSHLVSKINPKDRNFLKYLPDKMLSAEQLDAKNRALREEKEKISAIGEKSNNIKKQLKRTSNREILATALESVAKNDIERKKLSEYREKAAAVEAEQEKLSALRSEIKGLSFAKGKRDTERINELRQKQIIICPVLRQKSRYVRDIII